MIQNLKPVRPMLGHSPQNITQAVGMFARLVFKKYTDVSDCRYRFHEMRSKMGHAIRYPARQYHPNISEKHLAFWEKGRRAEARKLAN